jgi:hypothetical protein
METLLAVLLVLMVPGLLTFLPGQSKRKLGEPDRGNAMEAE